MSLFNGTEWEDMSIERRLAIKVRSEKSFLNFTRIWFELMQGEPFLCNWHHRYIASEVDSIVRSDNAGTSLAISLPPGGTKTELMSIALPAYTNTLVQCGALNKFRNLNLSFADSLVKRNSRRTRDIIASSEYQELWPCSFGVNQAEEWEVVDSRGKVRGSTVSRAMGGQITGGRGGYIGPGFSGAVNLDDPDKPEDMFSMVKREANHRRMVNTVRSRRGDKSRENPTPFFLTQQRLHVDDSIGFCVAGGMGVKFNQIVIPALITKSFIESLPDWIRDDCWSCVGESDSRVVGGEEYFSYWPEVEHIDQLVELWERDDYTFRSQYLQAPFLQSGGLIETDWFMTYEKLPWLDTITVYVDTNSGKVKDHLDYTVFMLVGADRDSNLYVLDVERGRWDPGDLLETAKLKWAEWNSQIPQSQRIKIRYMSIEDKQAGQGLITTLQNKEKGIVVQPQSRGADQNKYARHCNAQPQIKGGKVFIPARHDDDGKIVHRTKFFDGSDGYRTDWVIPFLSECDSLTMGVLTDSEKGFDDQYDCLMDAIADNLITQKISPAMARLLSTTSS